MLTPSLEGSSDGRVCSLKEATRDAAPAIDFVDGEAFCDLLKAHGIGVTVRIVEELTVDHDAPAAPARMPLGSIGERECRSVARRQNDDVLFEQDDGPRQREPGDRRMASIAMLSGRHNHHRVLNGATGLHIKVVHRQVCQEYQQFLHVWGVLRHTMARDIEQ